MFSLDVLFPCRAVLLRNRGGGRGRSLWVGGGEHRKARFASWLGGGADPQHSAPLASRGRSDVISGQDSQVAQRCKTGLQFHAAAKGGGIVAPKRPKSWQPFLLGYLPSVRNTPTSHFTEPSCLQYTRLGLPINLISSACMQHMYNLSSEPWNIH